MFQEFSEDDSQYTDSIEKSSGRKKSTFQSGLDSEAEISIKTIPSEENSVSFTRDWEPV